MPTVPQLWHLSRLDFLAGADEDELCNALGYDTVIKKHPRRKSVPIEEGTGIVYGLSEGLAKVIRTSPSGRRVVDSFLRPGDLFGRLGDEGPKARGAVFLETLTGCTVLAINADRLRSYLTAHPEAMLTVVQLLEDRQRKLSRRIASLVFKDVFARVVETLLQLTVDIPESCPYGMAVDVRVTQSDLAELVGASRQAVNRCLRRLESAELLHRHSGVYCILDIQKLAALVDLPSGLEPRAGGGGAGLSGGASDPTADGQVAERPYNGGGGNGGASHGGTSHGGSSHGGPHGGRHHTN